MEMQLEKDKGYGKIEIWRTERFFDRRNDFKIYIDDVEIGSISNGEKKNYEVESGLHTLWVKSSFLQKVILLASDPQVIR